MVVVVNVVASGSLKHELDLAAIAEELASIVEYDPEKYPGAYFRMRESAPLITLYRTGKYIITGADSKANSISTREMFLDLLETHKIISKAEDEWFAIQNYVCVGDLDRRLNLSALAIGLGLESTEYEPEQFPGLVYRPPDRECVLLAFGSGKVVVTGASELKSAESVFSDFAGDVDRILS